MKVENISARLYTIGDIALPPGTGKAIEVPDEHAKSIEGITDLKVHKSEVVEVVEFKEVPTTKAEIMGALTAKGIKFEQSDSKAELQALLDAAK